MATQLPLTSGQMHYLEGLAIRIQNGELPQIILEYKDDIDNLAFLSYMACAYQGITSGQLATILEIRSILQLVPLEKMVIQPINVESLEQDDSSINQFIQTQYPHPETKKDIDKSYLAEVVKFKDAYCIKFTIELSNVLTRNEQFRGFLNIGLVTKAITMQPSADQSSAEITWLSVGARQALSTVIYKEHVKYAAFHHGTGIDINKIAAGVAERARYTATSFPGRRDPESFHEMKAPVMFMIMHDEFHRLIISAIPNPVYDGVIHLARQFRTMSERPWSREIWHLFDMDFDITKLKFGVCPAVLSEREVTLQFIDLLSGNDLEGNSLAVLMPTPYCDTTWMFLIDLVKNEEAWSESGIKGEHLPPPFKDMYDSARRYINSPDANVPLAELLLKIKCQYLKIEVPTGAEIAFSKRAKGRPTFIEILVDGKPFPVSKDDLVGVEENVIEQLHVKPVLMEWMKFAVNLPADQRQKTLSNIPSLMTKIRFMKIETIDQATLQYLVPFINRIPQIHFENFIRKLRSTRETLISLEDIKALMIASDKLLLDLIAKAELISEFIQLLKRVNLELTHFNSGIYISTYMQMVGFYRWMKLELNETVLQQCLNIMRDIVPAKNKVALLQNGQQFVKDFFSDDPSLFVNLLKVHQNEMMAIINSLSLRKFFQPKMEMITPDQMITIYKDYSSVLAEHADALDSILQHTQVTNPETITTMLREVNNMPMESRSTFLTDKLELIKELIACKGQLALTKSSILFQAAGSGNTQDFAVVAELLSYLGGNPTLITKDKIESLSDKCLQAIIQNYSQKYPHLFLDSPQTGIKNAVSQKGQ